MLSRVLCATKTSLGKSPYVILGEQTWVHFPPPVCALSPQLPWVEWILFPLLHPRYKLSGLCALRLWQVALSLLGCGLLRWISLSKLSFFAIIHRTHSMTFRFLVSQPFSMENQQDRALIATGSFEEWDAFREA